MTTDAGREQHPTIGPSYYRAPLARLVVLSVFSFGVYQLIWFYQQWRREVGRRSLALVLALASPLVAHMLFRRVYKRLREQEIPMPAAGALGLIYSGIATRGIITTSVAPPANPIANAFTSRRRHPMPLTVTSLCPLLAMDPRG